MNKLVGRLKDFFYATTDYLIILLIVAIASGVIVWRLNSLFNENGSRNTSINKESTQSIDKPKPDSPNPVKAKEEQSVPTVPEVPTVPQEAPAVQETPAAEAP